MKKRVEDKKSLKMSALELNQGEMFCLDRGILLQHLPTIFLKGEV